MDTGTWRNGKSCLRWCSLEISKPGSNASLKPFLVCKAHLAPQAGVNTGKEEKNQMERGICDGFVKGKDCFMGLVKTPTGDENGKVFPIKNL